LISAWLLSVIVMGVSRSIVVAWVLTLPVSCDLGAGAAVLTQEFAK
jgi:phosphate/sulfate permease